MAVRSSRSLFWVGPLMAYAVTGCAAPTSLPPYAGTRDIIPQGASIGGRGDSAGSSARIAAMNAIAKAYEKLPHKSALDDARALLIFVQKDRQAFATAGMYDGQVWAQFNDGNFLTIANSEIETASQKPLAIAAEHARLPNDSAGPRAYVLGNSFYFKAPSLPSIAEALREVGYDVTLGDVTVDQLKAVNDAHVLVAVTHGGVVPNRIGKGRVLRQGAYGLLTATPVGPANDAKYRGDIADGAIYFGMGGFYDVKAREQFLKPTYVVSPYFFWKYVTFQSGALDNSLAVFATCLSASPNLVQPLLSVLQAKGLVSYLGWTKMTQFQDAMTSLLQLFNRTLPEDVTQNVIPVEHKSPPQAASIVTDAYAWMKKSGFTTSRAPGNQSLAPVSTGDASTLELFIKRSPGVPQLAPVLNQITLSEYNKDQPGTPRIAGLGAWGAPIRSGDIEWGIASSPLGTPKPFPPPLAGYTDNGDVRSALPLDVTNGYIRLFEDGISSNAVPLTEWDGKITVSETQTVGGDFSGSVTLKAVLDVSLRQSVNPMRAQIDGDLSWSPAYFTDFMPGSTGVLSGTGSYKNVHGGSPAIYKTNNEKALAGSNQGASSDTAVFDAAQPGGTQAHTCGSVVNDPATACLDIGGTGNDVATCTGGTNDAGSGSICPGAFQPSPIAWSFDAYGDCGTKGGYIPFTISRSTYALSVPSTFTCASGYVGLKPPPGLIGESTTFTFEFDAPKSPPTSETATGD